MVANQDTKGRKKKKDLYNKNTALNCEIHFQNYNYTKIQFFEGYETTQYWTPQKNSITYSFVIRIPHR